MSRQQSSSGPPEQEMVTVAVLPPRLPKGMAPPTGLGAADTFSWDEAINWQHNDPYEDPNAPPRKKSFLKKIGLTGERTRAHPDLPPFIMRQIPYDRWRKHYAKDADGNYRGTHAPAEDCLLKPNDVAKWRLGAPKTKADMWTRGTEALPVYHEAQAEGQAPAYSVDYDGPPSEEPTLDDEMRRPRYDSSASAYTSDYPAKSTIIDGKTAAEIIEEARNKPKRTRKDGWKAALKNGANIAMLGN